LGRILYVSPDGKHLATIDVETSRGVPKVLRTSDFLRDLDLGDVRLLEHDPFVKLGTAGSRMSDAEQRLRDTALLLVSEVLLEAGDLIYTSRNDRGQAVRNVATRYGTHPEVIYSHLRRYWQGGSTAEALRPSFSQCGGKH